MFRRAVQQESPLQVVGTITAYTARMAEQTGYKAIYLSGGGVAANSLGMPDLGISTMDDVITDAQRITDTCGLPLMVEAHLRSNLDEPLCVLVTRFPRHVQETWEADELHEVPRIALHKVKRKVLARRQ